MRNDTYHDRIPIPIGYEGVCYEPRGNATYYYPFFQDREDRPACQIKNWRRVEQDSTNLKQILNKKGFFLHIRPIKDIKVESFRVRFKINKK